MMQGRPPPMDFYSAGMHPSGECARHDRDELSVSSLCAAFLTTKILQIYSIIHMKTSCSETKCSKPSSLYDCQLSYSPYLNIKIKIFTLKLYSDFKILRF